MRGEYQLSNSAPGHYIPLGEDKSLTKAYFPDTLPPTIELTDKVMNELVAATHALGRLDGLGSEVDNPGTVFSSFVYKEAEQSSQVEGTRVTVSDIYRYELEVMENAADESTDIKDVREARNYILALEDAIRYIERAGRSRENITLELIKSLHEIVLE